MISGKDAGKTGKVIRVFPNENKVIVENINLVKKAVKKSDQYPQGGYVEIEKPVHISNVMLIDAKTNKPTKFKAKVLKDGGKIRISNKTGETI
jgi:large subunit ribosomal protein L24